MKPGVCPSLDGQTRPNRHDKLIDAIGKRGFDTFIYFSVYIIHTIYLCTCISVSKYARKKSKLSLDQSIHVVVSDIDILKKKIE